MSLLMISPPIIRPIELGRSVRHCEERSDEAIQLRSAMDCFAESIIGRRFAPTRWLAMTMVLHEQKRHDEPVEHLRSGPVLQTLGHEANARLRRPDQDVVRNHTAAAE